jgi:hypothetical protein
MLRWICLSLLVFLSACTLGVGGTPTPQGVQGGSTGVGPGISIDEALASDSTEPLLINGWLVISPQGEVRFCSALGDGTPPTCAGSSLVVAGLDAADVGELAEAQGVQWSEEPIQLLGSIENGRLVVSATSI